MPIPGDPGRSGVPRSFSLSSKKKHLAIEVTDEGVLLSGELTGELNGITLTRKDLADVGIRGVIAVDPENAALYRVIASEWAGTLSILGGVDLRVVLADKLKAASKMDEGNEDAK